MPLNVAQLTIGVNADVSQAQQSIQGLNKTIAEEGSATQSSGTEMTAAFNQVIQAIANLNAAVQGTSANMVESLKPVESELTNVASKAGETGSSMSSMGATGANAIGNINMAMVATGQQIGPLNAGMMLMANNLRQINTEGSTARTALYGVAAGLTAIGIAAAAAGAPLHQAQEGLKNSIEQTGASVSSYSDQLDKATTKVERLGRSQTDLDKGLTTLTTGFGDVDKALANLTLTEDLAARRHTSMEDAAKTVIRVYEGYGRTLKELGIDMVFTHNAQAGLDDANKALTNSTTTLANAQAKYDEAVQKDADIHTEAALARDKVAQASQTLADANDNLTYTTERIRLENEAQASQMSETTKAVQALDQATANLAYTQAKMAAQAEIPITNHAEEALRRVQDAELQLENSQARLSSSTAITQVEQDQLAASTDRVVAAQQKMAEATGGNILGAQTALRSAIQQQREELDRLHAKSIASVQDKNAETKAARDLQRAQEDYVKAQQTDKGEADLKAIENAHTLQAAEDAVNKARAAIPMAEQKDYANAQLRQLEQANQLRTANNQVRNAQEGLTQAYRDNASEALKLRDADFAVADAKRALDSAIQKHQEALDKVTQAQHKLNEELTQGQRALDALSAKVKGAAESQAKGWVGALNEMKAKVTDWLGHFGDASGKFLTFALPTVLVLEKLKGLFGKSAGGGAGGDLAGDMAATGGAAAGAEGGLDAAAAAGEAAAVGVGAGATALAALTAIAAPATFAVATFTAGLSAEHKEHALLNQAILQEATGHQKAADATALHAAHMLTSVPAAKAAGIAVGDEAQAILGNSDATKKLTDQIFNAIPQYQRTRNEHDLIRQAVEGHAGAQRKVNEQLSISNPLLAQHLSSLFTEIDYSRKASAGAGDFSGKMKTLTDDLFANRYSLDTHTKGGQADLTAINNVAVAIDVQRDNLIKHGATMDQATNKVSTQIAEFDNLMKSLGFTDEQIKQLNNQYNLIPPTVDTQVRLNIDDAVNALNTLEADLGMTANDLNSLLNDLNVTPQSALNFHQYMSGQISMAQAEAQAAAIAKSHAEGGIVTGPEFALIGEAGPEAILPLSDPRRALDILQQTGLLRPFSMGASASSVASSSGAGGGANVLVQNFELRVDGNLIHERDLPQYLKELIIPAAKRQGGNFFGGFG